MTVRRIVRFREMNRCKSRLKAGRELTSSRMKVIDKCTTNQTLLGLMAVVVLVLTALWLDRSPVNNIGEANVQVAALCIAALVGVLCCGRPGSARQIYGLAFLAFHIGLLVAVFFTGVDAIPETINSGWMYTPVLNQVIIQVAIGATGLILGMLIPYRSLKPVASVFKDDLTTRRTLARSLRTEKLRERHSYRVGLLIYCAGLIFIVAQLFAGGFQFTEGYGAYRDAVEGNGLLGYGFLLVALGAGLSASSRDSRIVPWVLVGIVLALFLPTGARSAALFPAAVVVSIRSRHERFRLVPLVGGVFGTLGLISIIQRSRLEGFSGLSGNLDMNPIAALAEMGSTVVTVYAANFFVGSGRDYWYGESIFVVPIRQIEKLFGVPVLNAELDFRFFSSEIVSVFGPVGGSPVAEGVRNGGTIGVFIVMFLTGLALAWVDSKHSTFIGLAIRISLLYALLVAVRNALAPVIILCAAGVIAAVTATYAVRLVSAHAPHSKLEVPQAAGGHRDTEA